MQLYFLSKKIVLKKISNMSHLSLISCDQKENIIVRAETSG